ncbi:MAG TPA: hypothetical protein V6D29_10515 [Leptolyngbyaceae cyanobacterium]
MYGQLEISTKTKRHQCPHCQSSQLQRIGVSGIRKCAACSEFVDVRRKNWLKRLVSA